VEYGTGTEVQVTNRSSSRRTEVHGFWDTDASSPQTCPPNPGLHELCEDVTGQWDMAM
jgi:hypothetical protein